MEWTPCLLACVNMSLVSKPMTRQYNPHFAAYYRWLILTHHLGIRIQTDSMLGVGCDDGYFLSQQVGPLKTGVDLQPCVSSSSDLSVIQADGCVLPFADKSFPAVFAFDIIEHVLDDDVFIASLTRVLEPGGHLWLSTPTDTSYLFPAWLTRRAMSHWGHQRVGYDVDDLVRRFPQDCHVRVTLWNASSFRFSYVLLRVLSSLSPALARLGAHLCFEIDRRLPKGHDHIFLEIVREDATNYSKEYLT